jgi:hypothetical protein
VKPTAKWIGILALLYVCAYFAVMARNVPAVNKSGKVLFHSSFRMARTAGRSGPITIETSEVTAMNYVFYPLDVLYYALASPNDSFNSLPAQ